MSYFEISDVEQAIRAERHRQVAKWGQQNHPDGTDRLRFASRARDAQIITDAAAKQGKLTWRHILEEEVREAFAETDPAKLREELVQVAACAVAWIEAIDRRTPAPGGTASDERLVDGPNGGC